jgi:hypothetical protein
MFLPMVAASVKYSTHAVQFNRILLRNMLPEVFSPSVKPTTRLHLLSLLGISGSIYLFPDMPLWRQIYVLTFNIGSRSFLETMALVA